ncbi:helix-turn-helix transcriptional regulator [Salinicoccus roseus]|uniref:Helix-turn-helix transcriptional regulator n=2 Tax=Salinicoccus roseus TaxID=45670 RepID=A0ABT4YH01_9STAP|nr:helix-turn-helix transcriptional regulator [Salinicoccus roseus]MDB0580100.1 helix-turn-helix transcriptional regulator [Salinicoccus roseus]
MDMEFGNKLKKLRMDEGMSQEELSRELSVSRQAVYKWESNRGYPDIDNLIRISDIFNVTIDELIRNDKDMKNKISIDEEQAFESLGDAGFYLGMIMVILAIFLFEGSASTTLLVLGMLTVAFFDDFIKSLKSIF